MATFLARGSVHLRDREQALNVALKATKDGTRPFVCQRLGLWYVLDEEHARSARGNPAWPGKDLT